MKCIVLIGALFFCSIISPMEGDRSIIPSDWAYVLLRGCEKCGVKKPSIPQVKTVSLSVKNKSDLDLFFNNPSNKSLYCPHSGLGIYKALSSFDTKENKKRLHDAVECDSFHKVVLGKTYVIPSYKKEDSYPWLNVKKFLFTGGDLLMGNIRYNKYVVQELYDFFSVAEQNQFDVYNVISNRWSEEFIADIYQACTDKSSDEEFSIDPYDIMASVLDCDDTLLSFAVSNDGLTSAVSLNRTHNGLFLLKNDLPEVLMLGGCFYPIIKTVFSKNNKVLVTVSSGLLNACMVWDVETGKEKSMMFCSQDTVSAVAVSDDGSLIALFGGHGDGVLKTLNLWNGKKGVLIAGIDEKPMPDLVSLEFSPDKKWLLGRVIHELDYLLLWKVDIDTKKLVPISKYGPFSACTFMASGNLIAFADYEGIVYILDTYDDVEKIKIKKFVGGRIRSLLFHPKSSIQNLFFAHVYDNGFVYSVWNFIANVKKDFFFIPSLGIASAIDYTSITFNDNAKKLLLGANNCFVFGDWIRK